MWKDPALISFLLHLPLVLAGLIWHAIQNKP